MITSVSRVVFATFLDICILFFSFSFISKLGKSFVVASYEIGQDITLCYKRQNVETSLAHRRFC